MNTYLCNEQLVILTPSWTLCRCVRLINKCLPCRPLRSNGGYSTLLYYYRLICFHNSGLYGQYMIGMVTWNSIHICIRVLCSISIKERGFADFKGTTCIHDHMYSINMDTLCYVVHMQQNITVAQTEITSVKAMVFHNKCMQYIFIYLSWYKNHDTNF